MEDYESYVETICAQYNKTREEAESLALVREVKEYFENKPVYTE